VLRRARIWPLSIASAVLAATVSLAACGGENHNGASFRLTIGNLVPLTGALGDFGPAGRKAADLAVMEIRDAINRVGAEHHVTIRHADDQTDRKVGPQEALKLVEADDAACLAGPWAVSVMTRVAAAVSIPKKVLQISPAPSLDGITELQDDGLVNSTALPDLVQGRALAEAIGRDLGGPADRTINIGARDDAYGTGHVDVLERAWKEKGGEVGETVIYDPGQRSLASDAGKIASGGPDAFVIIDFPESYYELAPALLRTGKWDPKKTYVTDGLASDDIAARAGRAATEGIHGTIPGAPDEGAAPEAFDDLFATSAPRNVERMIFDAQNFDAVILCYLAAVAAGKAEGLAMADEVRDVSAPPGDKFTWKQLPAAVRALEDGDDIDYDGASGPINMDDAGDATAGVYDIFRYKNGRVEVFDEVPIAKTGTERDGN
jgi:ABC-type branched-subunit amino acid transport system substrate-binding protein